MNKKCINVLFALLLCFSLAGNGFAAPKSSAQDKGTVQDIVVRGTMLIDPERVKNALVTHVGDTVDSDQLDEDIRVVWSMGYFNDVTVFLEGRTLVVDVAEKYRINAVRVMGDEDEVSEEDALGAISTQPGTVLNEKNL